MKLDKYNLHEDFDVLAIWFREDQEMKDGIEGFCTINLNPLFLNYSIPFLRALMIHFNI